MIFFNEKIIKTCKRNRLPGCPAALADFYTILRRGAAKSWYNIVTCDIIKA
jgi:hypothetical protein